MKEKNISKQLGFFLGFIGLFIVIIKYKTLPKNLFVGWIVGLAYRILIIISITLIIILGVKILFQRSFMP